nr:GNAT family N-acetyltransferase [Enterovirga sp. DB1703]
MRPLRPEDDALYPEFDSHVSDEDRRLRFLVAMREIPQNQIFRLTHFDRKHGRAYAAIEPGSGRLLGVGRVHRLSDDEGEYAVLVRSDLKGLGLGHALMDLVLEGAKELGLRSVLGLILRENVNMIALCRELGFTFSAAGEANLVEARLRLS